MTIRYTSPHHSMDDPGGLIHDTLALGPDFIGPAEDVLLTWSLRLDPTVDPAAAAARLLLKQEAASQAGQPPLGPENLRLLDLLRQTAESCGAEAPRRRRGGWRGRSRPLGDR